MARVEIASTPHEEQCAQFGTDNYPEQAKIECRIFGQQIARLYGAPPEGCRITTHASNYNGDSTFEVAVKYDDTIEACVDYAFSVENDDKGVLGKWDDQARAELQAALLQAGLLQTA